MTWSGFRPSDDYQQFGYLVPSNMFAVVALGYLEAMATELWQDSSLSTRAARLAAEIDVGINKHAIVQHPTFGRIYAWVGWSLGAGWLGVRVRAVGTNGLTGIRLPPVAGRYEVDGLGKHNLMDDANVPSLLSIPYLGYKYDPEVYANTRRFLLSPSNPT